MGEAYPLQLNLSLHSSKNLGQHPTGVIPHPLIKQVNNTMTDTITKHQVRELQRKVAGLQTQVEILHSLRETDNKQRDRQIRDLEINAAVSRGLPKKEVAKIFKLTPGRISQLTSRSA